MTPPTPKPPPVDELAEPLALAVTARPLGRATVLDLGEVTIAIEPPVVPRSPFGHATLVPRDGAGFVARVARWLGVPLPKRRAGPVDTQPICDIGAVALQRWTDVDGCTWQRTKLCFGGIQEIYLVWEVEGRGAFLTEKDTSVRAALVEELAVQLRDGTRARGGRGEDSAADPLRSDPVPLVTELVRVPVRPNGIGCFWRDDRCFIAEARGAHTAIVSVGADGSYDTFATIDAKVRTIHAAGPHVVATDDHRLRAGGTCRLFLVSPGAGAARVLVDDPNFDPGQSARPVCSPDGKLIAISGRGHREGLGFHSWIRIVDLDGRVVAELDDAQLELHVEAWTEDGLDLLASCATGDEQHRRWRDGRIEHRDRPRQHRVTHDKRALLIHDGKRARKLVPGRQDERKRLASEYFRLTATPIAGSYVLLRGFADDLVVDCASARTWVLASHLLGALRPSPTFDRIAVIGFGGGFAIGAIDARWRTGAPPPAVDPAGAHARLSEAIEGTRYTFDGARSTVVLADWSARLGVAESELARRLDRAGRAAVASVYAAAADASARPPADWAERLASLDVTGVPGAVWAALAAESSGEQLATRVRGLAAAAFARSLQNDERVAQLLGA